MAYGKQPKIEIISSIELARRWGLLQDGDEELEQTVSTLAIPAEPVGDPGYDAWDWTMGDWGDWQDDEVWG